MTKKKGALGTAVCLLALIASLCFLFRTTTPASSSASAKAQNSAAATTPASPPTSSTPSYGLNTDLATLPTALALKDVPQSLWVSDTASLAKLPAYLAQPGLGTVVLYALPNRDCGSYSSGGAVSDQAYKSLVDSLSTALASKPEIVIVEPDALAQNCASRYALLDYAITSLSKDPNARLYVDAGNANWVGAADMASRLQKLDLSKVTGVSLNVSNFVATPQTEAYANQLRVLIPNLHYIIDTSRNGAAVPSGQWCNPTSARLGAKPSTHTDAPGLDATLWVKTPGLSDGNCNGNVKAGVFSQTLLDTLAS